MEKHPSLQHLEARRSIYDFLAFLFRREITKELLARIRETRFLEGLNEEGYAFDLQALEPVDSELITKLAVEYARLFIGPGPLLPPYESVHNPGDPKKGRLWGDSTVDVKKMVEFYGLRFEGQDYHGIPDHIAIEFEFMARLLQKEIEHRQKSEEDLASNCRDVQRECYEKHLSVWIPDFCRKLGQLARLNFYQQLGEFTGHFIQSDKEHLFSEDGK